ncbi:MAG: alkaline phosphatase [Candidatus Heimdallarchaeota archaeon]|nr:alkaline phosphatase [Candidatus Heimdallarchaeota archaeon]
MQKRKVNLLLVWFVVIITLQLSFGIRALTTQFDLNNKHNIVSELEVVPQIGTPTAITDQVLIFFVDGMRYDKMLEANTPNMDSLMANGTTFSNYHVILPSYSRVNYAAFSTGSSTNMTNVFANGYDDELEIPTLYSLITGNDLNKSLITDEGGWAKFLGKDSDVVVYPDTVSHSFEEGLDVKNAALATIPGNFSNIQFIGFDDVDAAGHDFGAASSTYIQMIENTDSYIGDILDLYDSLGQLDNTTIVLFSDHGHEEIGGHGGETNEQTHGYFIFAGKGVTNKGLISNKLTRINSITPTLLTMLGIPLAPTMNGPVLFDFIDSSIQTKAIYAIQQAEIMKQQLEVTINEFGIISNKAKLPYITGAELVADNITLAKGNYSITQYISSYNLAQEAEESARLYLSLFLIQLKSISELLRTLLIIGIVTLVSAMIFYLNRRRIIEVVHQEIFSKDQLIPQLLGMLSTISICIIISVIFGFKFAATSFNSTNQTVPPILTSFFVSAALLIFLPWLAIYLLKRKSSEFTTFKEWKKLFIKSSIGSMFFISLPIFGYILYYVAQFGPWPSWILPPLADTYAFWIIGLMPCILYIIPLILMLILWRSGKKEKATIS